MLSPADMIVIGAVALLFFGPDQLPKVARNAGRVIRDVQATSASFIREMERAADEPDHETPRSPWANPAAEHHAEPSPATSPFAAEAELVTPPESVIVAQADLVAPHADAESPQALEPEVKHGPGMAESVHHDTADLER